MGDLSTWLSITPCMICLCSTRCFVPFIHLGDLIPFWKEYPSPIVFLSGGLCLPLPACCVYLRWSLPGSRQAPDCLQSVEVTYKPELLTFYGYTCTSVKMCVGCVSRTEIALIMTHVQFSFQMSTKRLLKRWHELKCSLPNRSSLFKTAFSSSLHLTDGMVDSKRQFWQEKFLGKQPSSTLRSFYKNDVIYN